MIAGVKLGLGLLGSLREKDVFKPGATNTELPGEYRFG